MYFVNSASHARTELWDTIPSSVISGALCDKTCLYHAPRKALHKTICAGKSVTSEVVTVHQLPNVENPSLQPSWKGQLSDSHAVPSSESPGQELLLWTSHASKDDWVMWSLSSRNRILALREPEQSLEPRVSSQCPTAFLSVPRPFK